MRNKIWLCLLISVLWLGNQALGQGNETVEMADTMRSNGKIYVVIAVILTILTGMILYLVRLDRKISKLEKTGGS
jgi:CcmD family protein